MFGSAVDLEVQRARDNLKSQKEVFNALRHTSTCLGRLGRGLPVGAELIHRIETQLLESNREIVEKEEKLERVDARTRANVQDIVFTQPPETWVAVRRDTEVRGGNNLPFESQGAHLDARPATYGQVLRRIVAGDPSKEKKLVCFSSKPNNGMCRIHWPQTLTALRDVGTSQGYALEHYLPAVKSYILIEDPQFDLQSYDGKDIHFIAQDLLQLYSQSNSLDNPSLEIRTFKRHQGETLASTMAKLRHLALNPLRTVLDFSRARQTTRERRCSTLVEQTFSRLNI